MALYYTSINNKLDGRASYGYKRKDDAVSFLDQQNNKAASLNLKTKYNLCVCDDGQIPPKEIRS